MPELFAPDIVSTGMYERDVAITPDGKHFFFALSKKSNHDLLSDDRMSIGKLQELYNSPQNGGADIYWVSTEIIESLKPH